MGNSQNKDLYPVSESKPTFDVNYGFPDGRKEREMVATFEEMIAAKLPPHRQNYCAHLYIELSRCRRAHVPFGYRCKHERHALEQCEYEDAILRMKEYEREKRLRMRRAKKIENSEEMGE